MHTPQKPYKYVKFVLYQIVLTIYAITIAAPTSFTSTARRMALPASTSPAISLIVKTPCHPLRPQQQPYYYFDRHT